MPRTVELSYRRFLAFAALAVLVAGGVALIWMLGNILLMAFGAVLIAILLHIASEPFQRWTPLPLWAALLFAAVIVLGLLGLTAWIFGSRIANEFSDVLTHVHAGLVQLKAILDRNEFGRYLLAQLNRANISVTSVLGTVVSVSATALEALVVIAIVAGYLAVDPAAYRDGVVRLFPPRKQGWARETLDELGKALRSWLLGQLIEMALIGALSTFAVSLIGLPSPLGLGLIAAVAEFTPYLGPLVAAVPALLVALTRGPSETLWTLAAYLLIHQIEGNVIMPAIQRRMMRIPPAVMVLGIAAMGSLAGLIGFVFAAPLVVVVCVLVRKVYMHDVLQEPAILPGETVSATEKAVSASRPKVF